MLPRVLVVRLHDLSMAAAMPDGPSPLLAHQRSGLDEEQSHNLVTTQGDHVS